MQLDHDVETSAYHEEPAADGSPLDDITAGPGLRDAIITAQRAMDRVRRLVHDATIGGGEVGGLVDLLEAVDVGQAAAVTLTARVQEHRLAARTTGLSLDAFLACSVQLPDTDRRRLLRTADVLRSMPHLRHAVATGQVPAATLTAITSEARQLRRVTRAQLDSAFCDREQLAALDAEQLIEAVRDTVDTLAPSQAADAERRTMERRFLAVQPRLDGTLKGYFELDAEAGATLLEAIEAACQPPPCGPDDVSAHGLDDHPGTPQVPASWPRQAPGRARADALVTLAECYLGAWLQAANGSAAPVADDADERPAGHAASVCETAVHGDEAACAEVDSEQADRADEPAPGHHHHRDDPTACSTDAGVPHGTEAGCEGENRAGQQRPTGSPPSRLRRAPRRPRPRLLVFTDIAQLTGDDEVAQAARLLWATYAGPARLTPDAVRRLASDADLRFVLHHDGQLLGTTAPTPTIPLPLRDAVLARDHGCRFPGCRRPVHQVDLHHVRARQDGGPTSPDNLVALCRRHHTAVTTKQWRLDMTPDGTVTVRRGRRSATSVAPHQRRLPPARPG